MKKTMSKRLAAFACVFLYLSALGLFSGPQQEEAQAKTKGPRARRSLIRKDLLEREAVPLKPPLRNIFVPGRPGSQPDGTGVSGSGLEEDISGEDAAGQDASAGDDLAAVPDLRYIGYISSSERTVAVVIIDGEAMAVKQGDLAADGVTILKITPEEIVFQGHDAVSRTVSLEGEDR